MPRSTSASRLLSITSVSELLTEPEENRRIKRVGQADQTLTPKVTSITTEAAKRNILAHVEENQHVGSYYPKRCSPLLASH